MAGVISLDDDDDDDEEDDWIVVVDLNTVSWCDSVLHGKCDKTILDRKPQGHVESMANSGTM